MPSKNLLLYAGSETDADILYAARIFIPDPFLYFRVKDQAYLVLSDLELDRASREAPHCQILSLSQINLEIAHNGNKAPSTADVIVHLAKKWRLKAFTTPPQFPFGLATQVAKRGVKLTPTKGALFPEREIKTANEVTFIKQAIRSAERGMQAGVEALRESKSGKNGQLKLGTGTLTSERLRAIIDTAVIQSGGLAMNTIVAGGIQACDPHERGNGPLKANQPIILDIFPRSQSTGFFGDITRTVVKGKATDAMHRAYHAVSGAHKLAAKRSTHGASGIAIHREVVDYFEKQGFKTGVAKGRRVGFFHGTGHGLGLEIHEYPRIGATSTSKLAEGNVMTIEPGLYYPEIGGFRIEDDFLITKARPKMLSRFPQQLEV